MRLARLLPKLITLEPPPCIWFIRKIQNTKNSRNGSSVISALHHGEPPVRVPVVGMPSLIASRVIVSSCCCDGIPIVNDFWSLLRLKVTLEPG